MCVQVCVCVCVHTYVKVWVSVCLCTCVCTRVHVTGGQEARGGFAFFLFLLPILPSPVPSGEKVTIGQGEREWKARARPGAQKALASVAGIDRLLPVPGHIVLKAFR